MPFGKVAKVQHLALAIVLLDDDARSLGVDRDDHRGPPSSVSVAHRVGCQSTGPRLGALHGAPVWPQANVADRGVDPLDAVADAGAGTASLGLAKDDDIAGR